MGAEREQPGMPGWQATAACRGRLGTPARGSQELPTAQHFSAWMAWRQMPAPPFPPCCGPRLYIPVPLPSWGCSLPQPPWSSCLRGTPLTDPHPQGIAPSTSRKYTCTWNTISFCFKWAESLRGHPAPPGEKSRQALPVSPWPLPPWDNVPPTLRAVPPSQAGSPSHAPLHGWKVLRGHTCPLLVLCARGWIQARHPTVVSGKGQKL